ncbi:MAG: transaldolase family protein [Holosporaceae bacterium]|jgi:transaldolase|nr:transaldolase family protein [Holosporaceae bacterium]
MEIFLDTASIEDVVFWESFIDGVTTNPSLIAKSGAEDYEVLVKEICQLVRGPVSLEVLSEKYETMLTEGRRIAKINSNICVKLPCTFDGLRVCKELSLEGISTNMTLCFSSAQALLAAKCGATYVSPFVGRLEDVGHDGIHLLEEVLDLYNQQGYETRVLAASIRSLQHVIQAAMLGVDAITLPPLILRQCFEHPLTWKGLEIFANDLKKRK